ncbi:beta-L-arabinofuranosidase domain-containing protein [Rugamonas aquatica]|uniref:beta-L-arabinofuranosidase domain-containing protein n=1 Tax=Rugamonas aquatica TaxID=2743357 RepID=UPI001F2422BC|nr:beta-L-arabinofuranosidase domain-containing protein [Rugamonas aquatica]
MRRTWLALARRLYHTKVLLPLTQGRDELANLHANTQIPKLIGLARLHELTGRRGDADAVDFFWKRVTQHHSYVIGGNGDREYFSAPDSIAAHITEQTCEACASYNMLKMTRHLYSWAPDAAYFDHYERTHLNHILAHQNPRTGMFTYMTPLMSGVAREYSSEDNDFWCCVLSGMESHAKHGDSIYWENGDTLFVNLYIPSTLEWKAAAARLELNTRYPYEGDIELKVRRLATAVYFHVYTDSASDCTRRPDTVAHARRSSLRSSELMLFWILILSILYCLRRRHESSRDCAGLSGLHRRRYGRYQRGSGRRCVAHRFGLLGWR